MFFKIRLVITSKILPRVMRFLLVSSSISPIILIFGINSFEQPGHPIKYLVYCSFIFAFLFGACIIMLACFASLKKPEYISFIRVDRQDKDILAYLLLFLLPIIRGSSFMISEQPLTTIACMVIIIKMMMYVGMYHINPVLSFFRFRIYKVERANSYGILIARTKKPFYYNEISLNVVTISDDFGIYLHTRSMNV